MFQKNNCILKIVITTFSFICVFLFSSSFVSAADLTLERVSEQPSLGKAIVVDILISNNEQSINAVSGTLTFPSDKLSVSSISKDGSIVKLWAEEPGFINNQGTLTFEGVILNPGFSLSSGKIVRVTFTPKKAEMASLSFTLGSVLANDGLATNVLERTGTLDLDIKEGSVNLNKVITPTVAPASITKPEVVIIEQPAIISYSEVVDDVSMIKIRGKTYPYATVDFEFTNSGKQIFTDFTKSNGDGDFTLSASKRLPKDNYLFTARATSVEGLQSQKTTAYPIVVEQPVVSKLGFVTVPHSRLPEIIGIALIILLIIFYYFYRHFFVLKLHIRKDLYKAIIGLKNDFDKVGRDIKDQINTLEDTKTRRKLTKEELGILKNFNSHLGVIERNLSRNLETLGRDVE